MKKPVVFFHSDMEPDVRRIMSDPAPQGEDALTRALLNGLDVRYMSGVVAWEGMRIVQTDPAEYSAANMPRGALNAIHALKRRLGANDLFDDVPAYSIGMLGRPQ